MVLRTTQTRPADLLSELRWLPVQSRTSLKIACLTYKILSIGQPMYMRALLHYYTPHFTLEMCMGMGFPMGPGIPWEWGKNTELGMGMGGNGKPPQWEWELRVLPWEFIPKGFMLR